jgi:L-threonylcarbamoyladenylate synthase
LYYSNSFCTFVYMIILYPTETVYGLGVNPLDAEELESLYVLKGRDIEKAVSWLVRDLDDMRQYAEVSEKSQSDFCPVH